MGVLTLYTQVSSTTERDQREIRGSKESEVPPPLWDPEKEKESVPQLSHLPNGSNSNTYPVNMA